VKSVLLNICMNTETFTFADELQRRKLEKYQLENADNFYIPKHFDVEIERDVRNDLIALENRLKNSCKTKKEYDRFIENDVVPIDMKFSRFHQAYVYTKNAYETVKTFTNPISITPTFIGPKNKVKELASSKFTTALNKVSKKFSPNRFKKNKLLPCLAVQEYDDCTRLNIHSIFDIPDNVTDKEFLDVFQSYWNNLADLRNRNLKLDLCKKPIIHQSNFNSPERATSYLLKLETKDIREEFASFIIA
jgi:hypothetical protein